MTEKKKPRGRAENLVPFSERTEEEQREIRRKGGIASGKKRREHKAFKELFKVALQMQYEGGDVTNAEAIVAGMIHAAAMGDHRAFIAIRDTIGEKPAEKLPDGLEGGVAILWEKAK